MKYRCHLHILSTVPVAPVRERGLKSYDMPLVQGADIGRSRKGAWIEINDSGEQATGNTCRSRKGAWIEIDGLGSSILAAACRSRKGAWIEIPQANLSAFAVGSLP